jgi:MFS family permease
MKVQGNDLKSAGLIIAIPSFFSVAGMLVSGRIIDKMGSYSKVGVMGGMSFVALFLFLMTTAQSLTQVIVYQCLAYICTSFVTTFVFTLPHRAMKQQVVGTAFGMINFGGQVAGIL